jgi:two-component system chemotaxis sensor kinase CheA
MEKLINKRILVVDDDTRNTFALKSYLETFGMKVVVSENGKEAIALLHEDSTIDIILLDMMMPVMDGYETLALLKTTDSLNRIPVIAVTARAMKGDKEKCLECGAWDYISKPIDLDMLMDIITRWITKDGNRK